VAGLFDDNSLRPSPPPSAWRALARAINAATVVRVSVANQRAGSDQLDIALTAP
jgi:hypothetical protein